MGIAMNPEVHEARPVPAYTLYHPAWYRHRMSVFWWLRKASYAWFVLRELTSVFVAYTAVLLILELRALAAGPDAHARFLSRLASPPIVVLDAVALLLVVVHAVTWFNLAPTAMVVRLRGERVPDRAIAAANYAAWLVLSLAVAWVLTRG
jgi:fumarate reductase subunit C